MDTTANLKSEFKPDDVQSENNSVSLCHPRFKGRADRLDLITNQMVGFKMAIGEKRFTVCDLSETGFSYAEKVPVKNNLSYKQVKIKVDQIAVSNYGKNLKCTCFFEGSPERGKLTTHGIIKNHHLFLVLTSDEIKRTVTSYLQRKGIRRSHDPQGYFSKLDLILTESEKMKQSGCDETTLGIVINTTFQNLIAEIGAPVEIFDTLYQGYINKPVFVKYGVALEGKKEAVKLMDFATIKNSTILNHSDQEKQLLQLQRREWIKKLNLKYGFKDFVLIVWQKCLQHFNLESSLLLPKIEKEKVALALKEEKARFDGQLEKLVDPEYAEGNYKGLEHYICDGLYWHLVEKDKKYFDREVIKKEIRKVVVESYEDCLKSE